MEYRRGYQLLGVFIVLVILIIIIGGVYMLQNENRGGFDSNVWKEQYGKHEGENPRRAMLVNLKEHYLREGMTRDEVRSILGNPDQERGSNDVYYLGASLFGVNFEYFLFEYDSGDLLTRFYIEQG